MMKILLAAGLLSAGASAAGQSLVQAQEKQRDLYQDCSSYEGRALTSTDLDGDGDDEALMHYSFDGCKGPYKTGTHVVVFYKSGGQWAAAKGDYVLSATESKLYTMESAEGGVLLLKNVLDDNEALVRLRYAKGQVKRVK